MSKDLFLSHRKVKCPSCGGQILSLGCVRLGKDKKNSTLLMAIAACELCAKWSEARAPISWEMERYNLVYAIETLEMEAMEAFGTESRWPKKVKNKLAEAWHLLENQNALKSHTLDQSACKRGEK